METSDKFYEETYFQFKKINPIKFSRLSFHEVDRRDDLVLYCEDGLIIKFENKFYQCKEKIRIVSCPSGMDVKIEIDKKNDKQLKKVYQNQINRGNINVKKNRFRRGK